MGFVGNFLSEYGAWVVWAVVFIEQIGLPLPAMPLLLAAGVLAGTGSLSLFTVLLAAASAAVAADWIWYELGRRRGLRVLEFICRMALEPRSCVLRTQEFFQTQGPRSLVAAKFIPGLSTVAPPLAGMGGLALGVFLLYDGLGVALWVGTGVGLGYVFSERIEAAVQYAAFLTPVALAGMAAALSLYIGVKALRRRLERQSVPRVTAKSLMIDTTTQRGAAAPLFVDVRPRSVSTRDGAIPGALIMPADEVVHGYDALPRERDVIVYCGCPGDVTSADIVRFLHKKGFVRACVLQGGIEGWRAARDAASCSPIVEQQVDGAQAHVAIHVAINDDGEPRRPLNQPARLTTRNSDGPIPIQERDDKQASAWNGGLNTAPCAGFKTEEVAC